MEGCFLAATCSQFQVFRW